MAHIHLRISSDKNKLAFWHFDIFKSGGSIIDGFGNSVVIFDWISDFKVPTPLLLDDIGDAVTTSHLCTFVISVSEFYDFTL